MFKYRVDDMLAPFCIVGQQLRAPRDDDNFVELVFGCLDRNVMAMRLIVETI